MRDIEKLASEGGLSEDSAAFLDSIAYQMAERGSGDRKIDEELAAAIEVSKRYSDPVEALRLIDSSMEEYFIIAGRRNSNVGSIKKLNEAEKKAVKGGFSLNIRGLESRIQTELYGIEVRLPVWAGWEGPREGSSAWQDNAIRQMEDY